MYINCEQMGDSVFVWERHPDGRRLVTYPAPWNCYVEDENGKHDTLTGQKASFFEFDSRFELMAAVKASQAKGRRVFEGDIPPDLKILSEHYYEAEVPKLHVGYLDIEVDYKTNSYDRDHMVLARLKSGGEPFEVEIGKVRDAGDQALYELKEPRSDEWVRADMSEYMYEGPTGFSSIDNPYAPINAIALNTDWDNKTYVIAVPPPTWGKDDRKWDAMLSKEFESLGEIILVRNEKELLVLFLSLIQDADALIGWNSEFFDFPYIMRRVEIVLGKRGLRMLSFPQAKLPKLREVEFMGRKNWTAQYGGRILMDYMQLFKKFEMANRASYKLEVITEEIMPDLAKLHYEGTLEQLYRKDFNHFIRYNLRDTECLAGFEAVKGYIGVANMMYHMSTGRYRDVAGTLRLADCSIINYCHYVLNKIVPNGPEVVEVLDGDDADDKAQGALVLEPKAGMHEWIGSIDITSLYPSALRSLNASPETLRGQFNEAIQAFEQIQLRSQVKLTFQHEQSGKYEVKTAAEWREWLIEQQYSISGYGTAFDQSVGGVIPTILSDWFDKRKHYQKLKKNASIELDALIAKYEVKDE